MPLETILRILKKDATIPHDEIARLAGCSTAEVDARIAQLERDGVIIAYQAVVDAERLHNSTVTAVIEVKITPERDGGFDRIASRIAKFDQVLSCYLMSGGYDLLIVVEGDSLRDISSFIAERLSTIQGVIATATHFRLKTYKENGALLEVERETNRLPVAP